MLQITLYKKGDGELLHTNIHMMMPATMAISMEMTKTDQQLEMMLKTRPSDFSFTIMMATPGDENIGRK